MPSLDPPAPPACGHDAAASGAPMCEHLRRCEQPDLSCVQWFVGVAMDHELLCLPCAKQRQAGLEIAAARVCAACFAHTTTDLACVVGHRGTPGIVAREAPFSTQLSATAVPAALGAIADLAPLHAVPGSSWLLLTAAGALVRFDAGTGAWSTVAACSVPTEDDRDARGGRRPRRRLHATACGRFAAVVNDYGRRGQVLDLGSGHVTMELDGGDYHPETVPFSLAFVEARGRPLLVHRTAWNRLDLSDPATGELLSARPRPPENAPSRDSHDLDYFHGALIVSPSGTHVVDDGWIWHPVGVPVAFSLARWLDDNVWEPEDGPSRIDLCLREYYWDDAIVWLDDRRVAVSGIGDSDRHLVAGARVFDITQRRAPDRSASDDQPFAHEVLSFAGPAGQFFSDGGWLFSATGADLSRWDPTTGERTGLVAGFAPTHHHRGRRELAQLVDGQLVRLAIAADEDLAEPRAPAAATT